MAPVTTSPLKMPLSAKKPPISSMYPLKSGESLLGTPQESASIATAVGIILVIIVVVGLVIAAAVIRMKKRGKENIYSDEHVQYSKLIE